MGDFSDATVELLVCATRQHVYSTQAGTIAVL